MVELNTRRNAISLFHKKKSNFPALPEVKKYEKLDKKIKCLKCGTILSCLNNFYCHQKLVHEKPKPKKVQKKKTVFPCKAPECISVFSKLSKLRRYEVVHTREQHTCSTCGKTFQCKR